MPPESTGLAPYEKRFRSQSPGRGRPASPSHCCFHRDGHAVTLFEQFEEPRPLGSGLILQPTGLAVLGELGLRDRIERLGSRLDRLFGRDTAFANDVVLDVAIKCSRRATRARRASGGPLQCALRCGQTRTGFQSRRDGASPAWTSAERSAGRLSTTVALEPRAVRSCCRCARRALAALAALRRQACDAIFATAHLGKPAVAGSRLRRRRARAALQKRQHDDRRAADRPQARGQERGSGVLLEYPERRLSETGAAPASMPGRNTCTALWPETGAAARRDPRTSSDMTLARYGHHMLAGRRRAAGRRSATLSTPQVRSSGRGRTWRCSTPARCNAHFASTGDSTRRCATYATARRRQMLYYQALSRRLHARSINPTAGLPPLRDFVRRAGNATAALALASSRRRSPDWCWQPSGLMAAAR